MAGLRKILLVEDNVELRTIYASFLKHRGYDIATAVDGEDGLKKARLLHPDLIFLDIMMPNMDGFGVLRALRHDKTYGCTKTKIVLLTNLGDSSRVDAKVKEDMDGYVIKAEIDLSDLVDIIKSFDEDKNKTA